jgi:hypothetical protein
MRRDAGLPFDLLVFDSSSCAKRTIADPGKGRRRIQYLICQKNVGKAAPERDPGGRAGRDHRR